jgi:hypothetical protein
MANSQTYPQCLYPVTGDVQSATGSPQVTVTGIQQIPVVAQAPADGQILIYSQATPGYVPGDPIVSGPDAVGNPPSRNPVQAGGWDAVVVRELLVDAQGALIVSTQAGLGEQIQNLLQELRALKTAIIALDQTLLPQDFDGPSYQDQTTAENELP